MHFKTLQKQLLGIIVNHKPNLPSFLYFLCGLGSEKAARQSSEKKKTSKSNKLLKPNLGPAFSAWYRTICQ